MSRSFAIYTWAWIIAMLLAAGYLFKTRSDQEIFKKRYYRFLARPWKITTFLLSGVSVTLLGPYTTDPTWDWVDGLFMSALAFWTGPWAVGLAYRSLTGLAPKRDLFPALAVWLFSASWSYDIYLVWRDGNYPETWWSNLILSSILYFCAGLFWSLNSEPSRGVFLAFRENDWPQPDSPGSFKKVFWVGLPFMLVAAWLTLGFLKILK
jgi:hypothetical protein